MMVFRLSFVLFVALNGFASAAEPAEDARLARFFKNWLDAEAKLRPIDATRLGDHRFNDRVGDYSPAARTGWIKNWKQTLAELEKQFDPRKLSRSGQIDLEIFQHHLRRVIWLSENLDAHASDPRVYNDLISDAVYLPLTQSTLERAVAVKQVQARMAEIPKLLAAARASLKNPPAVMLQTASRQNRGAIRFYESGIFELVGKQFATESFRSAAAGVARALREHQKFLDEELASRATGDWRIGKEKFARKLELELNAGVTAEEVYRDAQAEFARVRRDMYVLARQMWARAFPNQVLPPDDEAGRRETIARVLDHHNQEHGKAENLVRDITAGVARIKEFIRKKDILRLPEPDRCEITEMPEFQRGNTVAYMNNAPPLDPRARSVYAISPPPSDWDARRKKSYLEEYNRHMLQILTIHEAYPGHYVQLEYSNRHPSLIRRVLFSGVFAEGWAVYSEQMMLDMGYGDGDLALRLNQLKFYLRAVANAILDHRMHCTGLSDDEALKFLVQEAFQSEGEAVGKLIRAKQSSVQLSEYFVGRMAFYRLRTAVQREQGERFSLGRFHEAVLDHGTLPVKYLPQLVRERLEKKRLKDE